MKTIRFNSPSAIIIFCCLFMLSFAGCEKEDDNEVMPMTKDNSYAETVDNSIVDNSIAIASVSDVRYEYAVTKHTGVSVEDKTYSTIIYSDGLIMFNGYRNTAALGQHYLQLDKAKLDMLKLHFAEANLSGFSEPIVNPEIPTVTVTYKKDPSAKLVSLTVNDIPSNSRLARFCSTVEQIMGVDRLVNGVETGERVPVYHK